jgi:hypothetical protein
MAYCCSVFRNNVPPRGKCSTISCHYPKDLRLTTLHRNVTPQSNSRNAPPANKSGTNSNNLNSGSNSSRSVDTVSHAGTYAKSRTTSENGVAVTNRSRNTNVKSKKPSKMSQIIEISDADDSDTLEREAALASPAKGAESRKATKVSKRSYMFANMY